MMGFVVVSLPCRTAHLTGPLRLTSTVVDSSDGDTLVGRRLFVAAE